MSFDGENAMTEPTTPATCPCPMYATAACPCEYCTFDRKQLEAERAKRKQTDGLLRSFTPSQ